MVKIRNFIVVIVFFIVLFLVVNMYWKAVSNGTLSDGKEIKQTPYPSSVIDLTNWKITLPTANPKKKNSPTEIKQPRLATFQVDPWFLPSTDGKGIRFRAPVNGVTTSGSHYPRSELREMENEGMTSASWSSTSGIHTMILDEAITAVPEWKRQIVAGQIHDDKNDILVIRLDYPHLYVNVDGKNEKMLDSNYVLGRRFQIKFVVHDGKTDVYYNNSSLPVYTLSKEYSKSYFKAGAYTQSNCIREILPTRCNVNNYGEVVVYNVQVTHF